MNWKHVVKNFFLRKTNDLANVIDPYWSTENFDEQIFLTTPWYLSDTEKENTNYHILYEITKNGFRTSSSKKNIKSNDIIACFGCSNTFGLGLRWEDVWVSQLQNMVGDKFLVKNYGMSGYSTDGIARLIFNYLNQYSPKIVCCFFPNTNRREMVMENSGLLNFLNFQSEIEEFENDHSFEKGLNKNEYEEMMNFYKAYKILSQEKNNIYNFIKNLKFIEAICELKKVKFYWGSWDISVLSIPKNIFDKQVSNNKFINLKLEDITDYDVARDDCHYGINFNKKLANLFYEKINQ
jgi:hypothetical protein